MNSTKERILVAMSGGVDSSVVAAILKDEGHEVVGVFMRNGVKAVPGRSHRQGCCGIDDARDARRVAERLEIPFYAVDLEDAFDVLIQDFVAAYAEGRTPNPCIECNRRFKMGRLLALATTLGATAVATGHYAKVGSRHGRFAVRRAEDRAKDQAYVLFSLPQEVLARTRFRLGDLTKTEVRALARRFGLPVAEKPESMEICFVPGGDYRELVKSRAPQTVRPGRIVDRDGMEVGTHDGTAFFTIGQRRGLPSGQEAPLYVTALDPQSNTVTVGRRADIYSNTFLVEGVVWSGAAPLAPGEEISGLVMIRAHHEAAPATATVEEGGHLRIRFDAPEPAITPGQAAVLFDKDGWLLAGGWIARAAGPDAV